MRRIIAFDRVDACVLGRVMYPEHEESWRGVVAGADETSEAKRYAEFADRTPHYVSTRSITQYDWPVAQPVSDTYQVAALRDQWCIRPASRSRTERSRSDTARNR